MQEKRTDSPGDTLLATKASSPLYSADALVWMKTLPSSLDRADLFALDNGDFAVQLIRQLVTHSEFELEVAAAHPASIWFNHFYFEARNREKVFGTRNFGIGYPMLLCRAGEIPLSAPLFVWQLLLEPHAQHPDHWVVQRTPLQRVWPNYPLLHHIDRLYAAHFSQRARTLVESGWVSAEVLGAFAEAIYKQLALTEEGLPLSIRPNPTANELERVQTEGQLRWAAVAGIFPTLPRTIDIEEPNIRPQRENGLIWEHPLTLLPLDPSQRRVLLAAQRHTLTVVEGASGTGKTYALAAIVANALANGKKCLVVSKSINALRWAQKFLLDKAIGDLSFVVRDTDGDRLMLADMLRAAAESKPKAPLNTQEFQTVLHRTLRQLRQLDGAWEALRQPLLGKHSFSELVGLFLQANRTEGKELLLSQLNPADFLFTAEEYEGIKAAIYDSEPLFRRFPTLKHPLGQLKHDIFLTRSSEDGLAWTETLVRQLLQKATSLHHRYIAKINEYAEALTEHYEQHYSGLAHLVRRIQEALEDGVRRFGAEFEKPLSTTEKLYGVFSERYKQIVAAKESIGADYERLRQMHQSFKYFEFDFPAQGDTGQIPKIAEQTLAYEKMLNRWLRSIPSLVRDDVRRLNTRSIHPQLPDFYEAIDELEQALDSFLAEFNEAGLYQEALKHEMLTLPKRQAFLESLIERLEDTQFYLRDFADFYIWQRHWLRLSHPEQQVVSALCKIKPRNWGAAFDSWYLYHFLQKHYHPELLWEEETLKAYCEDRAALERLLPAHIHALWHQRKSAALKSLRSSDPEAYKTWFGKNNRTLCLNRKGEELYEKYLIPLSETLPALFVTPQVALDVVRASNMKYDVVLVDEAHNIPKQEGYHLFSLAHSLVVFGDAKQDMTPSAEDDLLEYCKSLGAPIYSLDYQHQSTPQEWLRFNQIAFGTPSKRLYSGQSAREVTVVKNVEGRYDEQTGINEEEARQILDWLNLIEPTPAKTYPVVGIACATVEQRDYIAGQLLKIRQRKLAGHEKIQQLHLNGLGVYQFAELQGHHVEVLLISLVHGLIDARGTLTQHLHFWNTPLGFNQLHVLMTRATQRLYIAHSIPSGLYKALAANKNFRGTCVLSHLVTFGELIQQGDTAAAEEQLAQMSHLLGYSEAAYATTLFQQEVEIALQPYFLPAQLKRHAEVEGVIVPLVADTGKTRRLLLYEGILSHSEVPSYEWEERARRYFARRGVEVVPTFSAQWWKSPRHQARKVAAQLLQ